MKVIILGGFLGAGKTSLLLQMIPQLLSISDNGLAGMASDIKTEPKLTEDNAGMNTAGTHGDTDVVIAGAVRSSKTNAIAATAGGQDLAKNKIVILENEIGKTSIDGKTLGNAGIEVREIFSGCVCCTMAGELASNIKEIEETLAPEWLLIEATGLAYPDKAAEAVREHIKNLELLKIVVLINAENFVNLVKIVPLISGQPQFADLILINKIDLADADTIKATVVKLQELNDRAAILQIVATQPLPEEFWTQVLR